MAICYPLFVNTAVDPAYPQTAGISTWSLVLGCATWHPVWFPTVLLRVSESCENVSPELVLGPQGLPIRGFTLWFHVEVPRCRNVVMTVL